MHVTFLFWQQNYKEFERCLLNLDNKYTFALDEASEYKHEKVNNIVKKKKVEMLSLYYAIYEVNMGLEILCQIHFMI